MGKTAASSVTLRSASKTVATVPEAAEPTENQIAVQQKVKPVVMVTDAMQFSQMMLVRHLALTGYYVRAAVFYMRDVGKLTRLLLDHCDINDFEVVLCADINLNVSWDKQIFDKVEYIFHWPLNLKSALAAKSDIMAFDGRATEHWIEIPNKKVDTDFLKAVELHGKSVKHIVYRSQISAVLLETDPDVKSRPTPAYSEEDFPWYETARDVMEIYGPGFGHVHHSSLAEREVWEWANSTTGPRPKVTVLLVADVYGEIDAVPGKIHDGVENAATAFAQAFYQQLEGMPAIDLAARHPTPTFVYLGDMIDACINSILLPNTDKQRFLVAGGTFTWPEVFTLIWNEFEWARHATAQQPSEMGVDHNFMLNNNKSQVMLGLSYKPLRWTMMMFASALAAKYKDDLDLVMSLQDNEDAQTQAITGPQ